MRRKSGGKEFIDNKGCRVSPRYLTIAENRKRKEGGTPPERGKENGAEGSRVPIKTGWFSETIRTSTMKQTGNINNGL